uniref:Putative sigma-70 region domain containing protein n=1 Tax=viral metagenome TaxID=1070528 RepID=A0A6M3L750_9ZZZZ
MVRRKFPPRTERRKFHRGMQRLSWVKYEGIVKTLAKRWSHSPEEYKELLQEGAIAYLLAKDKYDRQRGAFSTFLYWEVEGRMRAYLGKERRAPKPFSVEVPEESEIFGVQSPGQEGIAAAKQLFRSVSSEAVEVLQVIFSMPANLANSLSAKGLCNKALAHYFVKERGWTWEKAWSTLDQLKQAVKTILL